MVSNMSCVNPLLYFAFLLPGNQHLKQVAVCNCERHAVSLVRSNVWPVITGQTVHWISF